MAIMASPEPHLDLKQVVIVGELTTEDGPMLDDHFLVLVLADGTLEEIPGESDRARAILGDLRVKWGTDLAYRIVGQTSFASRVMYPEELKDRPLFVFRRKALDARELWQTIKRFGVGEIESLLTPELIEYLKTKRGEQASRGM